VVNSQLPIALHILGFLTARGGEPLTSDVMADTYGTSPVVLRRVLAKLQRAGLVDTKRGANGGSVLARDPKSITLRQAYEAVSIDPQLLCRHPDGEGRVARAMAQFMNNAMGDAERALLDELEAITVFEMDVQVRANLGSSSRPSTP
jgi:Rrf2 family protein